MLRNKFKTPEVTIVGGSTCGFFTALMLARQGVKTRLMESNPRIDSSPRTLIVTDRFSSILGDLCKDAVVNEIDRFELFVDGRAAVVTLEKPDLVVERSLLIRSLAEKAGRNGTEILTGRRLTGLDASGDKLSLTFSCNGNREPVRESANTLVGADGIFSKVAMGAGTPPPAVVPVIQTLVELPGDMEANTSRIWFLPDKTPYFFWLIPNSPTRGVLGLVDEDIRAAKSSLEDFISRKGLKSIGIQEAWVPLYTRWINNPLRMGKGTVYLVGDAARHVKVTTVGGTVTGFRGALGVVESILNSGTSRELKRLKRELDCHKAIRDSLNRFTQDDYYRLLDLLTVSVKHLLSRYNRDQSGKLLFNLAFKNPRLFLMGLRSLLINR